MCTHGIPLSTALLPKNENIYGRSSEVDLIRKEKEKEVVWEEELKVEIFPLSGLSSSGRNAALTLRLWLVPGMTQLQLIGSTQVTPLKYVPRGQSHPEPH